MEDVTRRPCAHCLHEFTPTGKRYSMAATYCPPCAKEYRTEYRAGRAEAWHAARTAKCACGAQLPRGCNKFCSSGCRRGGDEPERRTFTCSLPACHNLCRSSQAEATFCSNACKLIAKRIRTRGLHAVAVHPHWVMSQPVCGPTLVAPTLVVGPSYGPSLASWPLFGPSLPRRQTSTERECRYCGASFFRRSRRSSFCSSACAGIARGTMRPECPIEFATCPDTGCGTLYVFDARRPRLACCAKHALRVARRRRKSVVRAQKRGQRHESYTLREIAERDGWRCHLCGKKVPDRKYAARDTDPTIDHLIPQSHGGDDIKSNVALAHNRCNWERGNQGAAQLRLVG